MQVGRTNRRAFIAALGGAAAWPVLGHTQPRSNVRHIGVLVGGSKADAQTRAGLEAFNKGLAERGWTEGQNLHVDFRWADGNLERMEALAKELVDLSPDLIVGVTTQVNLGGSALPTANISC